MTIQQPMSREELRLERERMEVLKEQRRLAAFEFQHAGCTSHPSLACTIETSLSYFHP